MRRLASLHMAVRVMVATLCALALLQAMRPAVYSTRVGVETLRNTGQQHPTRLYREKLEYLSRELHHQVPAGTRVMIVEEIDELRLRLMEFATMHGIEVVVDAGSADLEVHLQEEPAAPHGVRLLTRKPAP